MNFKRLIALLVAGFLLLALPVTAFAAEAESFVKTKQTELITLLKQSKNPKSDPKIEAVCDQILDYVTMAKDSLGEQWGERTDAERKEFQSLLKQLVQRAYRKNLSKTLNYELSYVGEEKNKDGTLVKTIAKDLSNAREAPVTIDFKVHKADNQLKIRDIVTEGSSLTLSYRNQFARIIKKKGFDELLRRMKGRLEKDEE